MEFQFSLEELAKYLPTLGITGFAFWFLFLLRAFFAHGYKPYTEKYWSRTAVVAVNYRESEAVVRRSIDSVLAGSKKPTVFVIVFNGKLLGYEHSLADEYRAKGVQFIFREEGDKRRAMAAGARWVIARNARVAEKQRVEFIVHMDGDTIWRKSTLRELIKPFMNPAIDAVAAAQEYLNPDESVWTMTQALLSHWGHNIGQKWQSAVNSSSCLRGRTNAFRVSTLSQPGFLDEFEDWYFFGNRRKSGDDGTLTFLTLKYNYERERKIGGTFVQTTAVIETLAEPGWEKFYKMRVRCISNTHTRYFDAVFHRWFWAQSWRFKLELVTSVIIPLLFFTCTLAFVIALATGTLTFARGGDASSLLPPSVMFAWFMVGRLFRAPRWGTSNWLRLVRWPVMVMAFVFPLMFARWHATYQIFKPQQSWGSRTDTTVAVSFQENK